MVTALADKADRLRAVECGANDFITKPVDRTELRIRAASLLKMKFTQDAFKQHQRDLEFIVARRTEALQEAVKEVNQAYLDTVQRLALAAEFRDDLTAAHILRVGRYCALLARCLGLPLVQVDLVLHASPMHDVGKIGIPDGILLKPGPLTPEERHIMEQHTVMGARILNGSSSELLQAGEIIALSHHEKWDGTGYPHRLRGADIPLYGRICAVADVFDALTSKRPYKAAFLNDKALEIMCQGRGTHFDPQLLDLFLQNIDEVFAIQNKYQDPDD